MKNCESAPQEELKGGLTHYGYGYGYTAMTGYEDAKSQYDTQTNRWSATENSANNSWNCNFNNGNINNNNKYNGMRVRPVVAYDVPTWFLNLVISAFDDCCRNKRTTPDCIAYCEIANEDLLLLAHELYTCTYQPGVSTCFLVKYPKYREVFAAYFRDRIVHHFIYLLLNPLFEQRFVAQGNVSFNCRKGFGTLKAQQAVLDAIKDATHNYRREAWVFRGDIVSFFMSIDKRILWAKMEPFICEKYHGQCLKQVLYATKTIIFHRPENNCLFNTPLAEWAKHVEQSKSLLNDDPYHGMPIGNLTTQIFANFLLSFFDEFATQWFKIRYMEAKFIRFVDDFVVVCANKHLLADFAKEAHTFLQSELSLQLHCDKYHFQLASHGMMFVGAYIKNHRMYLSNRTIARFTERVHGFNEMLENKQQITLADLTRMEQVVNSYLGFCKGKRTYAIRKRILHQFSHRFYDHAYIHGHYERIRIKQKEKLYTAV